MAARVLETIDDPQINLDAIAIENVPAWALYPEIPAKRGWSVQIRRFASVF